MDNKKIINQILDYIKDERYRQAILIDGEWGTGKTFLVKEKIMNRLIYELENKNIYYISLYGISSSEQIISEIYSSMIEKFIDNNVNKNHSTTVKKGITITSKLLTAGMKYFNISPEELPKMSDLKELKETIIFFDDLERCEIEINQMLGILNNLVEHNDVKIILIANQNEIGKMLFSKGIENKYNVALDNRLMLSDDIENNKNNKISYTKEQLINRTEKLFSEDFLYKRVKEKLIGLTIYYQPNFYEVFDSILQKFITNEKEKIFLINHKKELIDIFVEENHYNIRTLIFGLITFDKFYDIIDSIEFESYHYIEQELNKVLKYTMISAIKIKLGKFTYTWRDSSHESGNIYYIDNIYTLVKGYRFVDDYLLHCHLDKNKIKEVIFKNITEQKEYDEQKELTESLQYRKLYEWWELEDEEIEKIISDMLNELKEMKYDPKWFKDIIITFMQMNSKGFDFGGYNEIINLMSKKLLNCQDNFERRHLEVFSDNEYFIKKYNEIVKPLFEIIENNENKNRKVCYIFLCVKEEWNNKFYEKCQMYRDKYIEDKKFFYYIDPQKFISQLQEVKVANIYNFMKGVRKVYDFSNLNEYFTSDISNIKDILDMLEDIKTLSQGKITRKMALEELRKELHGYLNLIDKTIC